MPGSSTRETGQVRPSSSLALIDSVSRGCLQPLATGLAAAVGIGEEDAADPCRPAAGPPARCPQSKIGSKSASSKTGSVQLGGPVRAEGHQAAEPRRFVADVEHHPAVGQLHGHASRWDWACAGVLRSHDVAPLPGAAVVVAIDRRHARRVMRVAAGRKPHGNQQPAVVQLDAVPRSRGHHVPVVLLAELLEGRGDVHRRR